MEGVSYITIPFLTKCGQPNKNGRIFQRGDLDSVLLKRGYLPWKKEDRDIIPIRFFNSSKEYRAFIMEKGVDCVDPHAINEYASGVAAELNTQDNIARCSRVTFMNDHYHLSIPIDSNFLEMDREYFQRCKVSLVYTVDTNISHPTDSNGNTYITLEDIIFMDIIPVE